MSEVKPSYPLELPAQRMRAMVQFCMDRIIDHIESLPSQKMHNNEGGKKFSRALREPLPETAMAFEPLMRRLFGEIIPKSLNTASGGYLGYIPGGGIFHAALADLIANSVNRYVGIFQAAPGLVRLESNVVDWFCQLIGYGEGSGGLLTSGGSMANLIALAAARSERLPADFLKGIVYVSAEVHHSVHKSAKIAGFMEENIRRIGVDGQFRMRGDELSRAIDEDRKRGLVPAIVVASAGTTGTGAVDNLQEIADIADQNGIWFHIDAAYGGCFVLTERGKQIFRGIKRSDSVTIDPHKGMFLPYGTGCLVVRDRKTLQRTFGSTASYLPPPEQDEDCIDFSELGPELSRDFRGLRIWLPLKMHGAGVFREALDEKLDLARRAAEEIRRWPDVEIVSEPVLSLFSFRFYPKEFSGNEIKLNELNRRWLRGVNGRQRVFLTGVTVEGRFVLRICVLSFRTHAEHLDAALLDLQAALSDVVRGLGEDNSKQ